MTLVWYSLGAYVSKMQHFLTSMFILNCLNAQLPGIDQLTFIINKFDFPDF